jgi:hypothetical protein
MQPETDDNPVMLPQSFASRYLIVHKCLLFGAVLGFAVPRPAQADPLGCYAVTGNLIVNCGFETSDFTG